MLSAADRTIKIWDTASGQLRLTLTGHIEQARHQLRLQQQLHLAWLHVI
jgi:WD40 repeat protein